MAKYRKKPKIDEATQWFPGKYVEGVFSNGTGDEHGAYVITIHGQRAYLAPGDFVVTEPDGIHHYPCKPDIFRDGHEMPEE